MKKALITALLVLAAACVKKDANGTYRIENPMASKKSNEKARDNAAKSGDQVKQVMKKVEKGADKLAAKAGEKLEKAGKKLQQKAKTDAHR
jgi:phosphosulfolactate synthase (CoM biosynthesis protein A)